MINPDNIKQAQLYNLAEYQDKKVLNEIDTGVVSYPRCGSHWFRFMMEMLLEQPCWPEAYFCPDKYPWAQWYHDVHIGEFPYVNNIIPPNITIRKLIFLYRDPFDMILSNLFFEQSMQSKDGKSKPFQTHPNNILKLCIGYKRYLYRWLNTNNVGFRIYIQYKDLLDHPIQMIRPVLMALERNHEFTDQDILNVHSAVKKSSIKAIKPNIIINQPEDKRKYLKTKYYKYIRFCFDQERDLFSKRGPLIIHPTNPLPSYITRWEQI